MAARLRAQLRLMPRLDGARCAGTDIDPEAFFPPQWDQKAISAAAAICRTCPVRSECGAYAQTRPERHGVWGGTSAPQRKQAQQHAA